MNFHYLVRAIVLVEGKVLLAHQTGAENTFLPGGHAEEGESAEETLVREIEEELGMAATIEGFVGAVEHLWVEGGEANHEINLLFEVRVPGLDSANAPQALESHIEFIWSEPEQLKEHHLEPYPLIECLKRWNEGHKAYWGTTMRRDRGSRL